MSEAEIRRLYRKPLRLRNYDYSSEGMYFVTVCAKDKICLFGEIEGGEIKLNDAGQMIESVWKGLSNRFPSIDLDQFAVMPNHIHGIILMVGAPLVGAQNAGPSAKRTDIQRAGTRPAAPTVGDVVGAFKSITTNEYIRGVKHEHWPPFLGKLWQRNYYEHVIRNEKELFETRRYIQENPLKWDLDSENPRSPLLLHALQ